MLGVGIGAGVLIGGLTAISIVAPMAAGPLLAVGAGVALIGGGIGVAAWGIGQMAEGVSKIGTSGIGNEFKGIGQGLMSMSTAFLNPLFLPSLAGLTGFLGISSLSDLGGITSAFSSLNTFVKSDMKNLLLLDSVLKTMQNFSGDNMEKVVNAIKDIKLDVNLSGSQPIVIENKIMLDGSQISTSINKFNAFVKRGS